MWLKILVWLGTKKGKWVLRTFARGYNGKAYERYEYHIKLAKAMT